MTSHVFRLPVPPSTNNLYVNIPTRGRVPSMRYKTWRRAAENELKAQQRPAEPIAVPVLVEIEVGRKDKRRADVSNRTKAVEDILVIAKVLADDLYVADIRAAWNPDITGCKVKITELEGEFYWRAIGKTALARDAA